MITDSKYKDLPTALKAEAILFAIAQGYSKEEATDKRKPLSYTIEYKERISKIIGVRPCQK